MAVETQFFSERDAAQVRSDMLDCQVRLVGCRVNAFMSLAFVLLHSAWPREYGVVFVMR